MILLYLDAEIFFRETLDFSYLNTWYLGAEVNFKSSSFTCRAPGRTRATIAAGMVRLGTFFSKAPMAHPVPCGLLTAR
jgi:hypothetical protein